MLRSPIYKYFKRKPRLNIGFSPINILKNAQLALLSGSSNREHIFVVGPPRNGTTLVQKILANHSKVSGPDAETFFFLKRRLDTVTVPEIPERTMLKHFIRSTTKTHFFDLIADEYILEDQRFVEKTPEHSLVMARILKMFPRCRIVFIYRDGRDAFVSALKHGGVRSKLGQNYPHFWRDSMRALIQLKNDRRVLPIKYEDLCKSPSETLKPILDACDLDFQEDLVRPKNYSQTRYAEKKEHKRLHETITSKTVGIHLLPENRESCKHFESIASEMLIAFGYALNEAT